MDPLLKPLDKIQELFRASPDVNVGGGSDWGVVSFFQQLMEDPILHNQVPWLSLQSVDRLPNQCLVRFRGMIQDSFNPEYYLGAYQDRQRMWHTTKFADVLNAPAEADMQQSHIWERRPLVVVPVPGQSPWCTQWLRDIPAEPATPDRGAGEARKRRDIGASSMDSSISDMEVSGIGQGGAIGGGPGRNGPVGSAPLEEEVSSQPRKEARRGEHDASMEGDGGSNANGAVDAGAQQPQEEYQEGDCIVYVYDEGPDLKLHDVVEVVGVLSKLPQLGAMHMIAEEQEDLLMQEHLSTHPPTSKVFRLHAILSRKHPCSWPQRACPTSTLAAQVEELRREAIQVLALGLAGDELAAEYLLLQLLTQNESGRPGQVGELPRLPPLNLCHCPVAHTTVPPSNEAARPATGAPPEATGPPPGPSEFGAALQAAIHALWPACSCLPVSVQLLNSTRLAPWKSGESVRLRPGPLQLGRGTALLLDETTMTEGTIRAPGIDNLRVLQKLLTEQTLYCDFEVYTHSLPMDVPVVALSERRSFFRDTAFAVLPLAAAAQASWLDAATVKQMTLQRDLQPVRDYLCAARCNPPCEVVEAAADWVEQTLEHARQGHRNLDAEELHRMLLMARAVGSSFLAASLTECHWQHMTALEHRRQERLRVA